MNFSDFKYYINENPGLSSGEAKKKVFSQNLSVSVVGWLMSL